LKIQRDNGNVVVIGKRVTIGAAVGAIATIFANIYPEHAGSFVASATVVTFIVQIIVANWIGITNAGKPTGRSIKRDEE
jgi:hypothetical protein